MKQEERLEKIAKIAVVIQSTTSIREIYDLTDCILFLAGESDEFLQVNIKNIETDVAKYDELYSSYK